MTDGKLIPLRDPSEIPENMTEAEEREFWDTHEITEEFLAKAGPVPEHELPAPRPRTKPISLRLDDDVLTARKKSDVERYRALIAKLGIRGV